MTKEEYIEAFVEYIVAMGSKGDRLYALDAAEASWEAGGRDPEEDARKDMVGWG
ncbi:MAG: hypothetical protein WC965_01215 [Thiohalomonadaceae bacterium]